MRNSHSLLRNSQPKEDSQYVSFQSSSEKYIDKRTTLESYLDRSWWMRVITLFPCLGILLGQSMVDESNYIVPVPWNITCEKEFYILLWFSRVNP
jgi:hypothetical protein